VTASCGCRPHTNKFAARPVAGKQTGEGNRSTVEVADETVGIGAALAPLGRREARFAGEGGGERIRIECQSGKAQVAILLPALRSHSPDGYQRHDSMIAAQDRTRRSNAPSSIQNHRSWAQNMHHAPDGVEVLAAQLEHLPVPQGTPRAELDGEPQLVAYDATAADSGRLPCGVLERIPNEVRESTASSATSLASPGHRRVA